MKYNLLNGYALTFLRLWLGGAMMWYSFPALFQGGLTDFGNYAESLGIPYPFLMSVVAKIFEFFGGLMIFIGLYSRVGALMVASVLIVAVGAAHGFKVFTEGGIAFNLFIMSVTISLGGPGELSVNGRLSKSAKAY